MAPAVIPSPKTGRALVDEYFIENRTRLLEIASYLDRLERARDPATESDFRMRAFREALQVLSGGDGPRIERIQMIFSDTTSQPLEKLDRKSAHGAFDRWKGEQ